MRAILLAALLAFTAAAQAAPLVLEPADTLTAVMSGAAATTNPNANTRYQDQDAPEHIGRKALNGTTAVTLVTAPAKAQTRVHSVSIYNPDTAAVTVTLTHNVSGVGYTVWTVTLQTGDTLVYSDNGIAVTDTNGQAKGTAASQAVVPLAIPVTSWRRTDGVTLNTATASSTNHGVVYGSDGTNFPHLETIDGKAATTAVVSRTVVTLPPNYVAGSAVTIRVRCGMKTTVADGSTTVGLNVYSNAGTAQSGSADINTTSAASCNSLTVADKDFVITPTGLVAGQDLHVKLTQTVTDSATGTAVIGTVTHAELRTTVAQ